jgi:hypothetical protein
MYFGEPDIPWLSLSKHLHQSFLTAKFAGPLNPKRWGYNQVGFVILSHITTIFILIKPCSLRQV